MTHRIIAALTGSAILALSAALAPPARAEGGDRMPAGGAFMSSYVSDPYAPRGSAPAYDRGAFGGSDVTTTATVPRSAPRRPARPRR